MSASWNDIPDVALIEIYRHLPRDEDRFSLACACKRTHQHFSAPTLWRARQVQFGTGQPEQYVSNETGFLRQFGRHLKKMTLRFEKPGVINFGRSLNAVALYLENMCSITDINLEEMDLGQMHMENQWYFTFSRSCLNRIVTALCKMLRKQKFLKTVRLTDARLRLADGCRVLGAIARRPSGCTITKLSMTDFFEPNIYPCNNKAYVALMSKFRALNHIQLNYKYLNQEMVENMATRLSKCLKTLSLTIETDITGLGIPSDAWRELAERCPYVIVSIHVYTLISGSRDLTTGFVPGIPLHSCTVTSRQSLTPQADRIAAFLRHLSDTYKTSLEELTLCSDYLETVGDDVLYLLRQCSRMKRLSLRCKMLVDVVIDVITLQREGQVALSSLDMVISGLSDSDWQRVNENTSQLDSVHIEPAGGDYGSDTSSEDDFAVGNVVYIQHQHMLQLLPGQMPGMEDVGFEFDID